jgi:RHS repeat-associated protein
VALRDLTKEQKDAIDGIEGRQVVASAFFVRAGFDVDDDADADTEDYIAKVENKRFVAGLGKAYRSLAGEYFRSANPPQFRGSAKFGGVDLNSGEFVATALDISQEGRAQDMGLERRYTSGASYHGPFGPNWDCNLNARLVFMDEDEVPPDFRLTLLNRGGDNCDQQSPCDVRYVDGLGSVWLFRCISEENGNEDLKTLYSTDPAVEELLGGEDSIDRYYQSPDDVYVALYRLTDRSFALVQTNGGRIHFGADGRITRMIAPAEESKLTWHYREDGLLDRVTTDRGNDLEIYYYFPFLSLRRQSFDKPEENPLKSGRIAKVRFLGQFISDLTVEYEYDDKGRLTKVKPSIGSETVYGHSDTDEDRPNLIDSIEGPGGSSIPKQTLVYEAGKVISTTFAGNTVELAGAMTTLVERYDAEGSTVTAGEASFELDEGGKVKEYAGKTYDFGPAGNVKSFTVDSETEIKITYDADNSVHRFRGNVVKTERIVSGVSFISSQQWDGTARNRVESATDINGVITTFTYSGEDIKRETGDLTVEMKRNEYGQLITETKQLDDVSFETTFKYGSIASDKHASIGEDFTLKRRISRDSSGRLETYGNQANEYRLAYDTGTARILSETPTSQDFPKLTYSYDSLGRLSKLATTAQGQAVVQDYTYDSKHPGNVQRLTVKETGMPDRTVSYTYDDQGRLELFNDSGEETKYTYSGVLVTQVAGPGFLRKVKFNKTLPETVEENGIVTTLAHEGGRMTKISGEGVERTIEYDNAGAGAGTRKKQVTIKDLITGEQFVETFAYNDMGWVESVDAPIRGRKREMTYFPDGSLRELSINGQVMQSREKDERGRVTSVKVNQMVTDYSDFDEATGRPKQQSISFENAEAGVDTSFTYDNFGRRRTVKVGDATWTYTYDGFGGRSSREDPDGVKITETLSPSGFPLTAKLADGDLIEYSYTTARRLARISSSNGALEYEYNLDGLLQRISFPDGSETLYSGFNKFFLPASAVRGGVAQTMLYDDLGRLKTLTSGNEVINYRNDGFGQPLSVVKGNSSVRYRYNSHGSRSGVHAESSFMPNAGEWTQEVDALGRLKSEVYPSGLTLTYSPDEYGQATSVPAVGIDRLTWLTPGAPEMISYQGGVRSIWAVDDAMRTESIEYRLGDDEGPVIAGFSYEMTDGGRVLSEEKLHGGGLDSFSRSQPDKGMRITGFTFGEENGAAAAELAGLAFVHGELTGAGSGTTSNPASGDIRGYLPARTFVSARIATLDGVALDYDAAGSVTQVPLWVRLPGQAGLTRVMAGLSYDGFGKLRRVERDDGVEIVYARDPLGRIARRTVTGPPNRCAPSDTAYLWRDNLPMEEYVNVAGGWLLSCRYLYLGNRYYLVERAATPGGPMERFIPIVSRNGSIGGYLSLDGSLVERIDYSAYGYPVFSSNDDLLASRSSIANTLLFQGAFFDPESGLYEIGVRTLHPLAGAFLQREDLVYRRSLALYTAFDGDPVGISDPLGYAPEIGDILAYDFAGLKEDADDAGEAFGDFKESFKKGKVDTEFSLNGLGAFSAAAKLASNFTEGSLAEDLKGLGDVTSALKHGFELVYNLQEASERRPLELNLLSNAMNIMIPEGGASLKEGGGGDLASIIRFAHNAEADDDLFAAVGLKSTENARRLQSLEHLGAAAGTMATLTGMVRDTYFEKPETRNEHLSSQFLTAQESTLTAVKEVAEALKSARMNEVRGSAKGFGQTFGMGFQSRQALGASFDAGFEIGKFAIMFFSDEQTAKAYRELVQQFEDDGGYLTVLGGMLSTVNLDKAAHAIQSYQDFSLSDEIMKYAAPIINERERQNQRTQAYLNGLSAP